MNEPRPQNLTPDASTDAASPIPAPAPTGQDAPSHEHTTMMEWLKQYHAAGRLSDADLATALEEMNEPSDAPAADTRTSAQKEHDAVFPPAKPEQYDFPQHVDAERMTPDMKAADAMSRGWLSTALFSKEHGSALATIADRVAAEIEHHSPEQHALYARSQKILLENMWGQDTDKNMATAKAFVLRSAKKSPELLHMLNETGLGDSAIIISQLFNQAERLMSRNGEL